MAAVFEHSQLPPVPRLVLLALADHCDHDGYAWPSVDRLCHKTGLSRSSVHRALAYAEESGEVMRTVGGGRSNTNLYRIILVDNPTERGEKGSHRDTDYPPKTVPERHKRVPERHKNSPTVGPEPSITVKNRAGDNFKVDWNDPDLTPPEQIGAKVADIRAALKHGYQNEPLFEDEKPPA
jgi:DNA-binding transcriptional MocR family regulator